MNAPLSSPSLQKSASNPFHTLDGPTSAPQSSTSSSSSQQQQQPPHQPSAGQGATSPFLRDFNLVAEAAKRAQMACLMRDMEGIGLS